MSDVEQIRSVRDATNRVEQLLVAYTGERTDAGDRERSGAGAEAAAQGAETSPNPSDAQRRTPSTDESGETVFSRRLGALVEQFGLAPIELDALLVALAPDLEASVAHAFARLHGTDSLRRPTVDVLTDVLEASGRPTEAAYRVFAPSSPLVRWEVLDVRTGDDTVPFHARTVGVERRPLAYLLGDDEPDAELEGVVTVTEADERIEELPITDGTRERLTGIPTDRPMIHYFAGSDESVRRRAVEATCRRNGDGVVRADARTLATDRSRLDRTLREALFQDAAVHLTAVDALAAAGDPDADGVDATDVGGLVEVLDSFPGDVYLTGASAWTPADTVPTHEFALVEFPDPGYELRRELWAQRTDELPDAVSPTELAGTFELTQGEIDRALATARAVSTVHEADVDEVTPADVFEGCKAQSSANLAALAEPIAPSYTWDDIVLPADTAAHLREVADRITNRGTVYSEWGFERKFASGIGVVALFSGPSGTGKTMAAQVLANDAGLDLYRIDLSTVVSKYVGETEENLERIFDEAERSSAILLFDEADAIFGERSEVSDSTDRYANVEVNYLLQRIEHYDGVVLLTTNYESNIDSAFRRRIHLHVEFSRPDEEIRERLWRGIFPEETPTDGLDYEFLGTLELAGGEIRNAAQTAAFRAASEDAPVRMRHVVPAVRREREKSGALIDPTTFGEYREFLTD